MTIIMRLKGKMKQRYQIYCAPRIPGITFIRYAQNRNIGKPNNLKVFGSKKVKGPKQDS